MNDIQVYETQAKYEDFLDDKIPERRFRLVYPNKEVFYLTQEERDYLLNQVKNGAEWIEIGEHTFTKHFTTMYPIKDNLFKVKPVEIVKDGKVVGYEV